MDDIKMAKELVDVAKSMSAAEMKASDSSVSDIKIEASGQHGGFDVEATFYYGGDFNVKKFTARTLREVCAKLLDMESKLHD